MIQPKFKFGDILCAIDQQLIKFRFNRIELANDTYYYLGGGMVYPESSLMLYSGRDHRKLYAWTYNGMIRFTTTDAPEGAPFKRVPEYDITYPESN
jgi:hypothetical protein